VTQRQTPIARLRSFLVRRDWCKRPRTVIGDLHQSTIDLRVQPQRFSLRGRAVRKDDFDVAPRPRNDVRGGHHIPVCRHDYAARLRPTDLKGDGRGEDLLSYGGHLILDGVQVVYIFGGRFA
jgi:hypothetical protein